MAFIQGPDSHLYLNRAPFGGTLQGVAAASWAYLGKSPQHLTHAEAAMLAVLPQAPSRLRPDRHPLRAQEARDKVLRRLAEFHVWPRAAVDEALEEPLLLAPRLEPSLAPLLARRLNRPDSPPLIRTTVDATLQRRLEDLLLGWRARLPEHTSAAILVVEEESMAALVVPQGCAAGRQRQSGQHQCQLRAVGPLSIECAGRGGADGAGGVQRCRLTTIVQRCGQL